MTDEEFAATCYRNALTKYQAIATRAHHDRRPRRGTIYACCDDASEGRDCQCEEK